MLCTYILVRFRFHQEAPFLQAKNEHTKEKGTASSSSSSISVSSIFHTSISIHVDESNSLLARVLSVGFPAQDLLSFLPSVVLQS